MTPKIKVTLCTGGASRRILAVHSGAFAPKFRENEIAEIVPKKPNAPPNTPNAPRVNSFETAANLFAPQMHRRCNRIKVGVLRQKVFTVDFLTKTRKKNEGEVPQYYVENSHPAIVSPDEWDAAQKELDRRKALGRKYSGTDIFSTRLVCADCGEFYGAKTWHSNSKYRKVIWRCTHKYNGEDHCHTPNLSEETIKERFLMAINMVYNNRDSVLEDCRTIQKVASDCTAIDAELATLQQEMEVVSELTRRCIEEHSRTAQGQQEFAARYNGYVERYDAAEARVRELKEKRRELDNTKTEIGGFMFEITELQEPVQQFDEALWKATVDRVLVQQDGTMIFRFQGGIEITTE